MPNYDFTACLSPLDFELLCKDLLEAELDIRLENFGEGRDKGIDLRCAHARPVDEAVDIMQLLGENEDSSSLIVQCKRYSKFSDLKAELKNKELKKIEELNPYRYILTTSVSLSPQQAGEIKALLSPYIRSTDDIYGRDRLNSLLASHEEIERRHIKLWVSSTGVLDSILNAGTHIVSREEVERTINAARIYVRNTSFDEALEILKKHRVCIISGLPGIGKTTLARMLLLYFFDRKFDVVKIESDISEARAVGYYQKPRFYYYDDFLGQTGKPDKLNKNEDQKLLDFMASVRDSKDSVFILTTREYILNQAKLHYEKLDRERFDHRTCIVDLAKYSRRIRAQILYNHLHFSTLHRSHIASLIATQGYAQIVDHKNYNPRLIEYLTNATWIGDIEPESYLALFLKNLDNPVEIWGHAFRNQLSDRARHLLFVLTTLPTELRITDLEQAFVAFHDPLCLTCGIPHRPTDFRDALKELDGTFVASWQVQVSTLIRFQNPSIRDFMQNLLLGSESLKPIITSLIYFEQAKWFAELLTQENPRLNLVQLTTLTSEILDALQRLATANSCSLTVTGIQRWQEIKPQSVNLASRLASIAGAFMAQPARDCSEWMRAKLSDLASAFHAGELPTLPAIDPLTELYQLGCLASEEGRQLISELKACVLAEPQDLDDFEAIANLQYSFPDYFTEDELQGVRETFDEFAERYPSDCDLGNPEELRAEASRVGEIGKLLDVNTDGSQSAFKRSADEIEEEQRSNWDPDPDIRHSAPAVDVFSDPDLNSMFGTLAE
jgi:hypothetical protein